MTCTSGGVPARPPDAKLLSFSQEGLWVIDRVSKSAIRGVLVALRVTTPVSPAALRSAITTVIAHHDVLSSRIESDAQGPYAIYDPGMKTEINEVAVERSGESFEDRVTMLVLASAREPFTLSTASPSRWTVYRSEESETIVSATVHHIMTDLWSLGLITQDLNAALTAELEPDTPPASTPAPSDRVGIPYWDFAARERSAYSSGRWDKDLDFWRGCLEDVPAAIALPSVSPGTAVDAAGREPEVRFVGDTVPAEVVAAADGKGRSMGCTAFVVFLACVGRALSQWLGSIDVVVSTPITARRTSDTTDTVGLFLNRLVVPLSYAAGASRDDWLLSARGRFLKAFVHGHIPYSLIVREVNPARRFGGAGPWSQISCQLFPEQPTDMAPTDPGSRDGLDHLQPFPLPPRSSLVYDLSIEAGPLSDGRLGTAVHYRSHRIYASQVTELSRHLVAAYEELAR